MAREAHIPDDQIRDSSNRKAPGIAMCRKTDLPVGANGTDGTDGRADTPKSAVLHRDLGHNFLTIASAEGNYVVLNDGRRIFDGSGGASVACIGHGNPRVIKAIVEQLASVAYCLTTFYTTRVQEELCRELVNSTHGHMSRAYIVSSGKNDRSR